MFISFLCGPMPTEVVCCNSKNIQPDGPFMALPTRPCTREVGNPRTDFAFMVKWMDPINSDRIALPMKRLGRNDGRHKKVSQNPRQPLFVRDDAMSPFKSGFRKLSLPDGREQFNAIDSCS
jgi:hypothetical protein